jgi:hypothetical protein
MRRAGEKQMRAFARPNVCFWLKADISNVGIRASACGCRRGALERQGKALTRRSAPRERMSDIRCARSRAAVPRPTRLQRAAAAHLCPLLNGGFGLLRIGL